MTCCPPLRKTRVSTVAVNCTDVCVLLNVEGAIVGLPLATMKICDPKGPCPGLNEWVREEHGINGGRKPGVVRQRIRFCSAPGALLRGEFTSAGSRGDRGFCVHR